MEFTSVSGGVCAASGISACGVSAGFRRNPERLDLALIACDHTCTATGVFTRNVFCAAPVSVSRANLEDGRARAIILNSGNANAATGELGMRTARNTTRIVADELGCEPADVLVASTGVIGVPLDTDLFISGVPKAVAALSAKGGNDAARAIMTTDTRSKESAVSFELDGIVYHVGGMVKGSGMIMPDMATMLCVLTTDADMTAQAAHEALLVAVADSFNKVTVDSDTSTNDSCYLLATGAAGGPKAQLGDTLALAVESALAQVTTELAKMIARDGEGASRLIEVTVTGAADEHDADLCARAIANSPLVKTAIAGHDANWGRIAMAMGKCGARFRQEDASIDIMHIPVCRNGLAVPFDEDEALRRFDDPEVAIDVDLGAGDATTRIWTCDFTHDYIRINGDYRT